MPVTSQELYAALAATWPPARVTQLGPVQIREGRGGGARVSAASTEAPLTPDDRAAAEAAMRALGQAALWSVRPDQTALDETLDAAGYVIRDRTCFMTAPVDTIAAQELPLMSAFRVFPPLAIQREIWAEGGIGPARIAVMERAAAPRISLMGRVDDQPAGACFIAIHNGIAMVHALEILSRFRRKGLARNLMVAAARWAREHGAETLGLAVTTANEPARTLYAALGFTSQPGYHYRILQQD